MAAGLGLLLIAGCGNQPPGSPNTPGPDLTGSIFADLKGTAASESNVVPPAWARAQAPVEPAPAQIGGTTALLNEVCFRPAPGSSQFVEIRAASGGTSPTGLVLHTDAGLTYALPANLPALGAAELLLIVFDGKNSVDGRTVHADIATFMNANAGTLSLRDSNAALLDQVSWGDRAGGVDFGVGGERVEPEDGMTLGRLPGATSVSPTAWTAFAPEHATPGKLNVRPGVVIMFPLNGSIQESGDTTLSWFPAAEAVSYRVQVSNKADMSAPIVDETVVDLIRKTLGEGTYFWRVQAVFADGSAADWSRVLVFMLSNGFDLTDGGAPKPRGAARARPTKMLNVPRISQRKDTTMLCLESNRTDDHAWDKPHAALDVHDWADNNNCALASAVMINHYYGGTLSQDRVGYEIRKDKAPGPEFDINYGHGNPTEKAVGWAIGRAGTVKRVIPPTYGDFWNAVVAEIDAGRPVAMSERIGGGGHATVIIGYDISTEKRYLVINNPWNPKSAEAVRGLRQYDLIPLNAIIPLGEGPINAVADDPAIKLDSDGDGINDFDELNRFGTSVSHADTDFDCIGDKVEIRASMFHSQHGWARYFNNQGGDGAARGSPPTMNGSVPAAGRPELDVDFDRGGLPDFMEDANHDGLVSAGEGDPFDGMDDRDIHVTGTIDDVVNTFQEFSNPNYSNTREEYHTNVHVVLDLRPNIDDGKLKGTAAVTWQRQTRFVYRNQVCADGLLIDTNTRQWTVNIVGQLFCDNQGKIGIMGSGTPDGSGVPMTLRYHDYNCNGNCGACYDVTEGSNSRPTWGSFFERGLVDNKLDLRSDDTINPPMMGESYHEVHLQLQIGP